MFTAEGALQAIREASGMLEGPLHRLEEVRSKALAFAAWTWPTLGAMRGCLAWVGAVPLVSDEEAACCLLSWARQVEVLDDHLAGRWRGWSGGTEDGEVWGLTRRQIGWQKDLKEHFERDASRIHRP